MRTFSEYLAEVRGGGSLAGKLELASLSVDDAKLYAAKAFAAHGFDLDEEMPNFEKHFAIAKAKAIYGKTLRKDMPVIDAPQVTLLQVLLKRGAVDLVAPWSPDTALKDPFPEGLSGEEARHFLEKGLRIFDGSKRDDIVNAKVASVTAQKLIPIQRQIYFDKAIDKQSSEGAKGSRHFLTNKSTFVASSDLRIIDGHHRLMSSILLDPTMKVKVLIIDLPIDKLLPMTLAFSDAIGNKRNH